MSQTASKLTKKSSLRKSGSSSMKRKNTRPGETIVDFNLSQKSQSSFGRSSSYINKVSLKKKMNSEEPLLDFMASIGKDSSINQRAT